MKGFVPHKLFILFIAGAALLQACRGSRPLIVDATTGQTFHKSSLPPDSLRRLLTGYEQTLKGISGKGKVIINQPGNHQRGTLLFDANRNKALVRYKNGLGIEGGRLLISNDSVLIYNRIDKTARKMSLQDYGYLYLNGIMPMNPIALLAPDLGGKPIRALYENKHFYYIRFKDGTRAYLDRKDGSIRKIIYPFKHADAITNFVYSAYATIDGFRLPRKIGMTSNNGRSSLLMLVQSLTINPKHLNFDPGLPAGIKINRL